MFNSYVNLPESNGSGEREEEEEDIVE